MTGSNGDALTWAARSDGIAHASRPCYALTLCRLKTQDPRWAWPEESRCANCQAVDVWPSVARVQAEPTRYVELRHGR